MLPLLRDDALTSTDAGFAVRISLPWIRSLPVASLVDVALALDGEPATPLSVALGDRVVAASRLASEAGWWFLQDRLPLLADPTPAAGAHRVEVSFGLLIPYLPGGSDAPLVLPFRVERMLLLDAAASVPSVSRDVA